MPGLPWFRVDSTWFDHDKMLWLRDQRGGYKAIAVYMAGLGWSVQHGTDGHIPAHAKRVLDADKTTITLLTGARLWEPNGNGWHIHNFELRQQLSAGTDARHTASLKANCIRWHGPNCGCWQSESDPNRTP